VGILLGQYGVRSCSQADSFTLAGYVTSHQTKISRE